MQFIVLGASQKIPWAEEPGRLQSMGSWRVRHDWATSLSLFTFMHWRRKWQPMPVLLPGESQGWGEPGGLPSMGLHRVGHDWSDLAAAAAGGTVVKNLPANAGDAGSIPVRKNPWRRKWKSTPVSLPGKFHGQRSLVGYSPWRRWRVQQDWMSTHAHYYITYFSSEF